MYINPKILNSIIYNCLPCRMNIGNCHYLTPNNVWTFTRFACIEKNLTDLTCNINRFCCCFKNNSKR